MKGDVVILNHPFTDLSGAKVRPALVVSANDPRLNSVIVAVITKNISRSGEPTQLFIDTATTEGKRSGLNAPSAVVCTNLFTVNEQLILKVIGSLSTPALAQVDDCLKKALGLS